MATFYTSRTTYGTASAVNRFVAGTADLSNKVVSWNDARMTRNALAKLSDRELEDIGLQRGEIDSIARSSLIR